MVASDGGSKATFKVGFDGPAVRDGEIDVAQLAPALLTLDEIFTAANAALNPSEPNVSLRIKATESGSFIATLSLDIGAALDFLDAMSANPDRVTAAKDLITLITGGGAVIGGTAYGLFRTLRFLRGRRPDETNRNADGTTSITLNATTIIVDNRTARLVVDLPTREAARKFVHTSLDAEGIEKVGFAGDDGPVFDDESTLILTPADRVSVEIPAPIEEEAEETTNQRQALLQIVSAHFQGDYLWRFTDGDATFTASMEYEDFLKQIDKAEVQLSKNDTLRSIIEERQTLVGSKLKSSVTITEVLRYIPGARQMRLL